MHILPETNFVLLLKIHPLVVLRPVEDVLLYRVREPSADFKFSEHATVYVTLVRLAGDVIFLADELVVVQDVELLSRAQLLATHHARKAVQVEHFVSRLAHQVARRDTLRTASALGAVPPAIKQQYYEIFRIACVKWINGSNT